MLYWKGKKEYFLFGDVGVSKEFSVTRLYVDALNDVGRRCLIDWLYVEGDNENAEERIGAMVSYEDAGRLLMEHCIEGMEMEEMEAIMEDGLLIY